jgi:hypothetical protein
MEKIATIGEYGSSNHLEVGIMDNGKLMLSISIWTQGGRYNQSVWLDRQQVLELLDAMDEWNTKCPPVCQYCGKYNAVAIVHGRLACGICK